MTKKEFKKLKVGDKLCYLRLVNISCIVKQLEYPRIWTNCGIYCYNAKDYLGKDILRRK